MLLEGLLVAAGHGGFVRWVEWVTVVGRMAHVQCGTTCATQLTYHIYALTP